MSPVKTARAATQPQPNDINLSALQSKDLRDAGKLMYRALNVLRKKCGMPPIKVTLRKPDPTMEHLFKQSETVAWGAYSENSLLGYIIGSIRDQQCHFPYFFVEPRLWENGSGGRLLSTAVEEMHKREMHFISHWLRSSLSPKTYMEEGV